MTLTNFGNLLLLLCATAAATFTTVYATRSRWRVFIAGRSLLYATLALTLVLVQNSASVFGGLDYPGRAEIRVLLYAGLAVTLANMVRVLIRVQRGKRDGALPAGDVTRIDRPSSTPPS